MEIISKYLASRSTKGAWKIAGCTESNFSGAVVIPALAESATLMATLCSLAENPPDELARFLVLVVVNQREDALAADRADNLSTLELLTSGDAACSKLRLAWVDAASPGFELPVKNGGVGFARRIGLDLALTRVNHANGDPILICLDADTLVRPDYLPALARHFEQNVAGAAVIPFYHQQGAYPEECRAITRYELFLRSYVLGLSQAGSPYGFHTVGSAMACRASAYVKMGGMNNRAAGEDFYFLQQLARTVGVGQVRGTVVYPSSRPSHRVPFGTGRSVSRLLDREDGVVLFYNVACFRVLAEWLTLVSNHADMGSTALRSRAGEVSPCLVEYLDTVSFEEVWDKLRRNHNSRLAFLTAFNGWFDGLKTMKLIHHLSAGPYPRCEPDLAVPGLLEWAGLSMLDGLENQLELLRRMQLFEDH